MAGKKIIFYVLIFLTVFCVVFLPGHSKLQELREENEQYQKRIELLEGHNEQLKEELSRMRQDPVYVEKKAREKLGIIKKGEIIYRKKTKNNSSLAR